MMEITAEDIEKNIDFFFSEMGNPFASEPASEATLKKFRGKLPDRLLAFWRAHGFCGFKEGLFWITNPEDYEPALEAWFSDTPALQEDNYYVIARNAFGELYLWGTHTGARYELMSPSMGWLYNNQNMRDEHDIRNGKADWLLSVFLALCAPDQEDTDDQNGKPLFERAVRKLGSPAANEMFAFTPALALGGVKNLSSLSKVDIHIHLDLLSQMVERHMLDKRSLAKAAFGPKAEWPKGIE
ncbi:MAG: DUF1851 domain-containing protein [Zoogloeaceae bacterium]|jgi:hypothetical protein|nr:DUF1851 domain-containing protein [Zoogloeaceae bacterium]